MGTIPLIESILDVRNAATLLFYLTLLALAFRTISIRQNSYHFTVIVMSLSLIIFPFLPASNLFFPVGFVIAERVLYMPSFGFCLLIAYGYSLLDQKCSQMFTDNKVRYCFLVTLMMLIASHSLRTIVRNQDWQNEFNLYTSGIKVNPANAKLYNNAGHVFEANKQYDQALNYFLNATLIQPDDLGAFLNVGRTLVNLNRHAEAEKYFMKAKDLLLQPQHDSSVRGPFKRIAPSHLSLFINLGNLISMNQSRLDEAEKLYQQAIGMRSDYVDAYINRADILLRLNRTQEAKSVYQTALLHDTANADVHYNVSGFGLNKQFCLPRDYKSVCICAGVHTS